MSSTSVHRHPVYGWRRNNVREFLNEGPNGLTKRKGFLPKNKKKLGLLLISIIHNIAMIVFIAYIVYRIYERPVCKGQPNCELTSFFNGSLCVSRSNFNETCIDRSCRSDLGLICSNQTNTCDCDKLNQYWNGTNCASYSLHGEACLHTSHCISTQNTICVGSACSCNSTLNYYNTIETKCALQLNETYSCTYDSQCLGDMYCSSGKCSCYNESTSYFNYNILQCSLRTLNNSACSETRSCRSDLGLSCQNNLCQCNTTQFWSSSGLCVNLLEYGQSSCTSSSHCSASQGLVCNGYPTSNTCNCPNTSLTGMCDCPSNQYWNGSRCVSKLNEYQTCQQAYQCSTGLVCDACSLTCSSTTRCDLGWTLYGNKCYIVLTSVKNSNIESHCLSLDPSKNTSQATIDSSNMFNYLKCSLNIPSTTFVANVSMSLGCSIPSSGSCYTISSSSPCGSHSCSCGLSHNVLCEYTI